MPCTHIWPPPPARASRPTPGAISRAPPGSHGSGAWISLLPAMTTLLPIRILHLFYQNRVVRAAGTGRKIDQIRQLSGLVTIRHRTAMSGVLGLVIEGTWQPSSSREHTHGH